MARLPDLLHALYRRNRLLVTVGWLHVALAAFLVGLLIVDHRPSGGVALWLTPLRYVLIFAAYSFTLAWLGRYVSRPRLRLRAVSAAVALSVLGSTATLLVQAGRGITIYYNTGTDFDTVIFGIRVALLGVDTLAMAALLLMFRRPVLRLVPSYLWGIRAGIGMFLFGNWIAGTLLLAGAAGTDSTAAVESLRAAHGVAVAGLQVLPLVGWATGRWRELPGENAALAMTVGVTLAWALLAIGLYRQAAGLL